MNTENNIEQSASVHAGTGGRFGRRPVGDGLSERPWAGLGASGYGE